MIRNIIDCVRSGGIIINDKKSTYCINTLSISIYILNEATVLNRSKRSKWRYGCIITQWIFIPKAKTFVELSH